MKRKRFVTIAISVILIFTSGRLLAQEKNTTQKTAPLMASTDAQKQKGSIPVPKKNKEKSPSSSKRTSVPLAIKGLDKKITLDVRDMNMIDVIKFLAMKGNFNVVTNPTVTGRVTLYLKSVTIRDALDIILISNNLAYEIKNNIVHIMTENEYVALYGRRFSNKQKVKIVRLHYAKPSYVLATLDSIKSELGKIIIDEDTGTVAMIDTPDILKEMEKAIREIDRPLETIVYTLQYAKADVIAEKLKARIDANAVGSITADERSNQLIVRALPDRRKEVEKVIKELDAKTKEVLIEARVIQVTYKPQYDVGVDWEQDFKKSEHSGVRDLTFRSILLNEDNLSTSSNLASTFGKIGYGNFTADQFEMNLRALKQVSDTKILSNPKLLVTNNEEAKIHIGDTVPYIISTTSGTGDNAITSEDVRFVDVGLKLLVTPTINDDGYVTMSLKPEISTVTTKIESKGGGIPQVNKTLVETTVMVKDGNTIVLAGLRKDDKSHVRKGVPILSDIPILGLLFSSQSDTITKTEIMIFITPHIVKAGDHFEKWRGKIKPLKEYEDVKPLKTRM